MILLALSLAAASPIVAVDGGRIAGEQGADRVSFRGIPFAAPPVGPLRWRPPAAVRRWTGVRPARISAPSCAQLDDGWNKANADNSAEDCLYLEVASPTLTPAAPMPVMVWIHGGSNKAGGGAGAIASSIVRRGIVLVSIQYRLGPLGFMAHPALTAEGRGSGNYGLMDQQAALRWVRRNIARFGGDARNVTIAGESAGGQDVGLQQVSPLAAGLFDKAIEESGTAGFGFPARDLSTSEAIGEEIAGLAGAPHANAAALRMLPVAALLGAARRIATPPGLPEPGTVWLQTTIDGHVITEPPARTLTRRGGQRVPLLIGSNAREIGFFPTADAARAALTAALGDRSATALRHYQLDRATPPADDPLLGPVQDQVATDLVFSCPATLVARSRYRSGVPVWQYLHAYDPAGGPALGHASEIRYMFGNAGEDGIAADAPRLQAYWANFVRSGNPNGPGLATWPRLDAAGSFIAFGAGKPVVGPNLRSGVCDLTDRF